MNFKSVHIARAIIAIGVCSTCHVRTATAQNLAPKLSLAHPDWVSSESFSSIVSLRVLSNGAVLVADGKDIEVHLLDASGKAVRQIGRQGAGPAEYSNPAYLIPLPADSTLLIDLGTRRYLTIDPHGNIVNTQTVPPALGAGADGIISADTKGRLYFGLKVAPIDKNVSAQTPIGRWTRGTDRFDTVTMFHAEDPQKRPVNTKGTAFKELSGKAREAFAPVDDWVAAPSGRIAIIHAIPYRVDWVELNGKITQGKPVAVTRVPVTDADRKTYEPNGPPYRRTYAALKSPFMADNVVVDSEDNAWVPRSEAAQFKERRWDVFSATGVLRGTVLIPSGRKLLAITAKHAYLRYADADGLEWVERYAR